MDRFKKFEDGDIPLPVMVAERENGEKKHKIWMCIPCRDTKKEAGPMLMNQIEDHFKTMQVFFALLIAVLLRFTPRHEKDTPLALGQDFCQHFASLDIQASTEPILVSNGHNLEVRQARPFSILDWFFDREEPFFGGFGEDYDDDDEDEDEGYYFGLY